MVPCGAAICLVGLWMAVSSNNTSPQGSAQLNSLERTSRATGGNEGGVDADVLMQVLVTNKYQRDDESTMYMYPWEHVAEPVRDTRMEIASWPGKDNTGAGLDFM